MKETEYNKLSKEDQEYLNFKHLKETAYYSRKTSNNVQAFFWITVISAGLAVLFNINKM